MWYEYLFSTYREWFCFVSIHDEFSDPLILPVNAVKRLHVGVVVRAADASPAGSLVVDPNLYNRQQMQSEHSISSRVVLLLTYCALIF